MANSPLTKEDENKFIEGYWADGSREYPNPLPTQTPVDAAFLKKLQHTMDNAFETEIIRYRGLSRCRLCKENVGSVEYVLIKNNIQFRFPQGLMHYYQQHYVQPSSEFITFILNY